VNAARLAVVPSHVGGMAPAAYGAWLADKQVAVRLGISASMVRKLRCTGQLAFVMIGRLPRVSEADLAAFLERQRAAPGGGR
jgi:excisionase family DNA binding protein